PRNRSSGSVAGRTHPILWIDGTIYHLEFWSEPLEGEAPDDTLAGEAVAINSHGQIVGWYVASDQERRACLWRDGPASPEIDLNDLLPEESGWVLTEARDINNRGQIVGKGIHDGQIRAFLLTLPALDIETVGYVRPQLRHERLPRMGSGPMTENPASPVWALTTGAVGVAAAAGLILRRHQRADA
ncbi:MAG TPA: hypothetical protein VGW38_25235, partial [Chloroflexota bacterium]|nr:hypothetical protein [Chloroflexota bacterium]